MTRISQLPTDAMAEGGDRVVTTNQNDGVSKNLLLSQVADYILGFFSARKILIESQLDFTTSEPATLVEGDVYINTTTGISSVSSIDVTADYLYKVVDGVLFEVIPQEGWAAWDKSTLYSLIFTGTAWILDNNFHTTLDIGTVTAIALGITSDGSVDDVILPEANTTQAGLLGAGKWNEIVANTVHKTSNGTDHTYIDQDLRTSASPTFVNASSSSSATANSHLVRLDQLNSALLGLRWSDNVDSIFDNTTALPVAPSDTDRYIALVTANGWTANNIYEWDSATSAWAEFTVVSSMTVGIVALNTNYTFNGTNWVEFGTTNSHNNLMGLQGGTTAEYYHLTSAQHAVATQATTNLLSGYVNTGVQTFGGVKTFTLAPVIPITDAGVIITATTVEGALQENRTAINLNTAKLTNVSTNLSEGTATLTTVDVNSSDGTNATLVSASTTRAGLLTKVNFDEIGANTSARHSILTIGTANGLSLPASPSQVLSLGLASTSANGSLSSIDWNTFNNKQVALNGTGFVKASGATISYDNSTYSTDIHSNITNLDLVSGTNTGDNAINTLYSGLVTNATHTGEVTGATTLTITANAVTTVKVLDANITNAKLANMATKTYKGRTSALTGVPEDVAVATLKTDLILVKADVGLGNVDNTSDLGKPVSTAQQSALDLKQNLSEKDALSGYAGLDGSGKINPLQLPALAITDTFVVATQVAMLALTAEVGDVAVRTDLNKSYILKVTGATVLANWQELLTPTDAVSSVFGRSGVVTAQSNDYTWNQVNKATSSLADVTTRNFSDLQNKPTTVAGYGITDVYTETEVDALDAQNVKLTGNQTIGGTKTFSVDAIVNGLTVGRGAGNVLSNTIVGDAALTSNTTGQQNTIAGYAALQYNTIGSYNTAIGNQSLILNTGGSRNTANGSTALYSNTIGINNTVIGEASLYHNTTGSNNTALGKGTGWGITTGSNNTALGKGTGGGITTGSGNSIFGANVAGLSATLTNNIILANGTGAIKAQHDGTNWIFSNNVSASNLSGTNTGDQTTIVGITGTKAQFDTAVTDGNIMYIGDAPTAHTHTFASLTSKPTTIGGYGITDAMTTAHVANALIAQDITDIQNLSGTNTGDQDLSGLTTTLSQRDTSWGESYIQNFRSRVLDQNGEYFSNSAGYEFGKLKSQGWNNRPVLAMIPAAVKAGTLFSQLPANNVGDFTVVRNGTAHYANEEGLLKIALANVPRVNYSNGDGSLLTEPQATNLITYPISFGNSYWTKSGASIEGDASTAGTEDITNAVNRDFSGANQWVNQNLATFDSTTGAVLTVSSTAIYQYCKLPIANFTAGFTNGKTYLITYDLSSLVGAWRFTLLGTNDGSGTLTAGTSQKAYVHVSNATAITALQLQDNNNGASSGVFDNVSVKEVQGYSSPSVDFPTSAFKLVESATTAPHKLTRNIVTVAGLNMAWSIIAKQAERRYIVLRINSNSGSPVNVCYDLSDGSLVYNGTSVSDQTSVPLANGFYGIPMVELSSSVATRTFGIYVSSTPVTTNTESSYLGDGTSGIYIAFSQSEVGNYATSPTFTDITLAAEGIISTRLADSVTGAGDATLFSGVNTSGVLYGYIASHETSNAVAAKAITISDGTTANRVLIGHNGATNQIFASINVGGAAQASFTYTVTDVKDYHKVAISFALNSFNFYVDGVLRGTDASGSVFGAGVLTGLQFTSGASSSQFYGKTKGIIVYDTELSGADMITLTTL